MEKLFLFCVLLYSFLSLLLYKRIRGKAYIAPLVPILIAAGQAAYQMHQAGKQKNEASKAEGYVPPALKEEENIAKLQSNATRYAGQDQDEAMIRQNTADTFANVSRSTTSSGDLLNAASKISASQDRAMQGIAKNNQIFRQGALDRYRNTLARKAGAQMQSRMYAENLRGAAAQNTYNAVNTIAGGVAMGANANDWNKTFGKNTNPTMIMNPMLGGNQFGINGNSGAHTMSTYGWNPSAFSAGGNFFNPK